MKSRMAEPLGAEMRPIIDESLNDVGAVDLYAKAHPCAIKIRNPAEGSSLLVSEAEYHAQQRTRV